MSPDGQFVAFVSRETGQEQVYVRPTSGGRRVPVSTNGGSLPRWRRDGRELYYRGPNNTTVFALPADTQRGRFDMPQLLFSAPLVPTVSRYTYATLDGLRFVVITRAGEDPSITWVLNGIGSPSRGVQ